MFKMYCEVNYINSFKCRAFYDIYTSNELEEIYFQIQYRTILI